MSRPGLDDPEAVAAAAAAPIAKYYRDALLAADAEAMAPEDREQLVARRLTEVYEALESALQAAHRAAQLEAEFLLRIGDIE